MRNIDDSLKLVWLPDFWGNIQQVFLVESIKLAALQSHGPSFQI